MENERYIINYIHNYDEQIRNTFRNTRPRRFPLFGYTPIYHAEIVLPVFVEHLPRYRYTPIYHDEIVLPAFVEQEFLIPDDEIVLPAFVEQEFLIPDDAVCGITFEKPDCCTPCTHYFCRADITRWLEQQKNELRKMTCPSCRAKITQVLVAKNK